MTRVAPNLSAIDPDFMRGIRYLIHDRNSKFAALSKHRALMRQMNLAQASSKLGVAADPGQLSLFEST